MEPLVSKAVACQEDQLREAFLISGALLRVDCRNPRWHLLYVDTLLAKGKLSSEHMISVASDAFLLSAEAQAIVDATLGSPPCHCAHISNTGFPLEPQGEKTNSQSILS